eukprot:TRINITY_DN6241_c0_g1_i2.p1 TRINITY_DN6241_c0_g1~~TRINITY_DN6241_c0_g1_i2.p1  ORF type:complete len:384 (+),score=76.18 TRINITY_DN6241_c0_g1_i2:431-1582(+)
MRPIDCAAVNGKLDVVRYLVENHGVNPFTGKRTARQWAEIGKQRKVMQYLDELLSTGKFKNASQTSASDPASSKLLPRKHSREPSMGKSSDRGMNGHIVKKPKLEHETFGTLAHPRKSSSDDLRSNVRNSVADIPKNGKSLSRPPAEETTRKAADTLRSRVPAPLQEMSRAMAEKKRSPPLDTLRTRVPGPREPSLVTSERRKSPPPDDRHPSSSNLVPIKKEKTSSSEKSPAPPSFESIPRDRKRSVPGAAPPLAIPKTPKPSPPPAVEPPLDMIPRDRRPKKDSSSSISAIPKFPSSSTSNLRTSQPPSKPPATPPSVGPTPQELKAKETAENRAKNLNDMLKEFNSLKRKLKLQLEIYETSDPKHLDKQLVQNIQKAFRD